MCDYHENQDIQSSQTRLADSTLMNMALMQSIQCVSDQVLSDCLSQNVKVKNHNEVQSANSELKDHNQSIDFQNVACDTLSSREYKSFYKTKSCKYSFIASDYTSAEGQKLLNIQVFQKPLDENVTSSKGKHFLSKRSISEYFPSRNHSLEKDVHSDKVKEWGMMKAWQRTFGKPQVFTSPPIQELRHFDASVEETNGHTSEPTTVADVVFVPHRKDSRDCQSNCYSAQDEHDAVRNIMLSPDDNRSGSMEGKHLIKNYSLNPNVNFKVFDIESLSESGEPCDSGPVENNSHFVLEDAWFMQSACGSNISGSTSAAQLSITSSFGDSNIPTCKICHMGAKADDPLISPCRCIGTLRYIHCACLMKWLEICSKRTRKPPTCELCKYPFHWHKKFKVGQWQFPHCSWQDKILHTVFLISLLVMIGCAVITVLCFKQHRDAKTETTHLELTQSEIITLICGALFFLAFFLAMYVEIKARNTLYRLMVKFIYLNQQWYIDEYDEKENVVIDV